MTHILSRAKLAIAREEAYNRRAGQGFDSEPPWTGDPASMSSDKKWAIMGGVLTAVALVGDKIGLSSGVRVASGVGAVASFTTATLYVADEVVKNLGNLGKS